MLNLHAPVEPGSAAAGFQLGQSFSELIPSFEGAHIVEYRPGFDLNRAINQNSGILIVMGFSPESGCAVFFGPETVRLVFSRTNVLGCIYVFEGYWGAYRGTAIGTPLSAISAIEPLAFDDGDEMYYRTNHLGEYLPGLAIIASNGDHEKLSDTPILGYCIHDWSLLRSAD